MTGMKFTFRWYGENDRVTLKNIRQIPVIKGIVSALNDIPAGEVWPLEGVLALKKRVEESGLELSAIESIPVHEDVSKRKPLPKNERRIKSIMKRPNPVPMSTSAGRRIPFRRLAV